MQSRQRATMSRWLVTALWCAGVTACDDADNGANTLSLSYSGLVNDSAIVHAHVTFPGFDQNFAGYGKLGPVVIPVRPRSGTIRLQFARIKGQADTIGKGEVSLKITQGNVYGALFVRVPANYPEQFCFGCTGNLKFPMVGSASASTDMNYLSYTNAPPLCEGCVTQVRERGIVVARKD